MTNTTQAQFTDQQQMERAYHLIRQQRDQIEQLRNRQNAPIAIIGRACRVPGAESLNEFHDLLRDGRDGIGQVPAGRWSKASECARVGGFIDAVDRFDPAFFGISPTEAMQLDPQHAMVLETGWTAIENAGIDPLRLAGTSTGVFLGISEGDFRQRMQSDTASDIRSLTGGASSVGVSRLSYFLGLHGPSIAIDTACSASLVAIHLAVQSLRDGECDMAVAGGVNALLTPSTTDFFNDAGAISPDGRCKSFSAAANGYVRSEGCAMVLLKPLSAALSDGDTVCAVILGSAINQDGRTNGLMSPNGGAQQRVIIKALERAAKRPEEIGYVEAHGTGTALGDPIELGALAAVFGARKASLPVGSVKSNIGHLESGAGAIGLLKAARIVETGIVPKNLHFDQPSPYLNWEQANLRVPSDAEELPVGLRTVGVSSFGFSGTNAHIVLTAPPSASDLQDSNTVSETGDAPHLLKLSARSTTALRSLAERHAACLTAVAPEDLDVYCRTSAVGRSNFAQRLSLLADTPVAMIAQLRAWLAGERSFTAFEGVAGKPPTIAFLLTGQGGERPCVGREMYKMSSVFRSALDDCDRILRSDGVLKESLLDLLFSADQQTISRTANAQPLLFSLSYALAQFWHSVGIEPEVLLGHSTGEFAAACLAGCFSVEDGLSMIARRGRLIEEATKGGATAAVLATAQDVAELLAGTDGAVSISAYNAPRETLIGGAQKDLDRVMASALDRGLTVRKLSIPYAPHTVMVEPAIERFRDQIAGVCFARPERTLLSNLTGDVIDSIDADYFCRQLREPIRFSECVVRLQGLGCNALVELGPEPVLQLLARQSWTEKPPAWLSSLWSARSERRQVLENLAQLYAAGARLDWAGAKDILSQSRRRVATPTYPFDTSTANVELPVRVSEDKQDFAEVITGLLAHLMEARPESLDRHASFVDLGADSLLLGRLALEITDRCGAEVSIGELFDELNTIERLAEHLDSSDLWVRAHSPRQQAITKPLPEPAVPAMHRMAVAIDHRRSVASADALGGRTPPDRGMTVAQQQHVNRLIERYQIKTKGSAHRFRQGGEVRVDTRLARIRRPEIEAALYPIVGSRAKGAQIWDVDGNSYIDLTMGIGSLLCGHSPDFIQDALAEQSAKGIQNGPLAELADDTAQLLRTLTGKERVLFGLSGTSSVMNALRIARALTGRDRIAIFRGAYHGQSDQTLAIPDIASRAGVVVPAGAGVPVAAVADTLVLPYGADSAFDAIKADAADLAAVLVEPVQSRNPAVQPVEFLTQLRELTAKLGIPLIFDEIITGLRSHPNGVQGLFGIEADLTIYGKSLGGGMPVSAVAGKALLLDRVDRQPEFPNIPVGTTFDMHPLCLASAHAMLSHLVVEGPRFQHELSDRTERLCQALTCACQSVGAPISLARFGSMFRFAWKGNSSYAFSPLPLDIFYLGLLDRGLYLWEGRTCFLSTAHSVNDEAEIIAAVTDTLAEMEQAGFFADASSEQPREAIQAMDESRTDLTTGQLWLVNHQRQAGADAAPWCVTERFTLEGALDLVNLREAVRLTVVRHEALRCLVDEHGKYLRVQQWLEPDLQISDLTQNCEDRKAAADYIARQCVTRPFQLDRNSPLRMRVMRLDEQQWDVVLCCHHVLSDSISLGIIRDDIAGYYSRLAGAASVEDLLPASAAPKQDVLLAYRNAQKFAPRNDDTLATLREELSGLPRLVGSGSDGQSAQRSGQRLSRRLDRIAHRTLSDAARSHGMTPYMLLFAAFGLQLHCVTSHKLFCCGVPRAARPTRDLEQVVGYCADIVPVIVECDPAETLQRFMDHTKAALISAQRLPFGCMEAMLLAESAPERANALPFDAIFNLDPPVVPARFVGLMAKQYSAPSAFALTAYRLDITHVDGEIWLDVDYQPALIPAESIESWVGVFEAILLILLDDAGTKSVRHTVGTLLDRARSAADSDTLLVRLE